jgi:hypothetical protein
MKLQPLLHSSIVSIVEGFNVQERGYCIVVVSVVKRHQQQKRKVRTAQQHSMRVETPLAAKQKPI